MSLTDQALPSPPVLSLASLDGGRRGELAPGSSPPRLVSLAPKPVALADVVDGIESTARTLATLRGNSLMLRRQAGLGTVPARIADVLTQTLDRLLLRAAAETRDGRVVLSIARHRTLRSDWLEVELADSGTPMRPRELAALLKHLRGVASGVPEATDIRFAGLAACQALCVGVGGGLSVDSGRQVVGNRYVMRLPATGPS